MDIWIWATSTYFLLCSIHVHLLVVAPGQSRWNQKATNSPISNSLKFLWYGWWYFYSLSGFTSRESLLLIADHTDPLQDGWWAECEKRMESEESPIDDPLGGTGSSSSSSAFSPDKIWCWWNNQVTSNRTPHPDHPRPLMERKEWKNLNGAFFNICKSGQEPKWLLSQFITVYRDTNNFLLNSTLFPFRSIYLPLQGYGRWPSWLQLSQSLPYSLWASWSPSASNLPSLGLYLQPLKESFRKLDHLGDDVSPPTPSAGVPSHPWTSPLGRPKADSPSLSGCRPPCRGLFMQHQIIRDYSCPLFDDHVCSCSSCSRSLSMEFKLAATLEATTHSALTSPTCWKRRRQNRSCWLWSRIQLSLRFIISPSDGISSESCRRYQLESSGRAGSGPLGSYSIHQLLASDIWLSSRKGQGTWLSSSLKGRTGHKYLNQQTITLHVRMRNPGVSSTRLGRGSEKQEMWSQLSWKILVSGLLTIPSSTSCR